MELRVHVLPTSSMIMGRIPVLLVIVDVTLAMEHPTTPAIHATRLTSELTLLQPPLVIAIVITTIMALCPPARNAMSLVSTATTEPSITA